MRAAAAPSGGPEGRQEQTYPHPDGPKAAGRTPASMAYPASLGKPQDAASMRKLNANTAAVRAKA